MIYDELRNYLNLTTDEDTVALFDSAVEVFDSFGVENYMDVFDATMGDNTELGENFVVDGLRGAMASYVNSILKEHGIVATEMATISQRIELCKGLLLLSQYEEKNVVRLILEGNESAHETVAELLSLTTSFKTDMGMSLMESVEDSLMEKLKVVFNEDEYEIVPGEDVSVYTNAFLKLKNKHARVLWAERFLDHPDVIGLSFSTYFKAFMSEMGHLFNEQMDKEAVEAIALEMVGATALSEATIEKCSETLKDYTDEMFANIEHITQFDMAVRNILINYHKE